MREYVLDTNAVIRYLRIGGGAGGERVQGILEHADQVYMSAVNLGEVSYILLRHMNAPVMMQQIAAIERAIIVVPADRDHCLAAAALKHRYGLGYADSFAAALAIDRGATLVSADTGFERCGKALKWLRLPPFGS